MKRRNKCKTNRIYKIGLILNTLFAEYDKEIWISAIRAANEKNVDLYCFCGGILNSSLFHDYQKNIVINLINKNKIDGLIIASCSFFSFSRKEEKKSFYKKIKDIPIVNIGTKFEKIPRILIDNKTGIEQLLKHLIEIHNYKKIAVITGPDTNYDSSQRLKIYKKILKEYNIPFDNDLIEQGNFTLESGIDAVKSLIDIKKAQFDVIIGFNDTMAISAMKELQRRGIKVPDDIAVAGFDNIGEGRCVIPPLTTVDQSVYDIGQKAFDVLIDILNNKNKKKKILFPAKLVSRRSCGCFSYFDENKSMKKYPESENIVSILIKSQNSIISNFKNLIKENIPKSKNLNKLTEWIKLFIDSLCKEIKSKGKYNSLYAIENMIIDGIKENIDVLLWYKIMFSFLNNLKEIINNDEFNIFIDMYWTQLSLMIVEICNYSKSIPLIKYFEEGFELYRIIEALIGIYDISDLKNLIIERFPKLGINSCYVFLYKDKKQKTLLNLLAGYDKTEKIKITNETKDFNFNQIIPYISNNNIKNKIFNVMSLFFKEIPMGVILFEVGPMEGVLYESLSNKLGIALRSIELLNEIKKYSDELEKKVKERTVKLEKANLEIKDTNIKLKKLDLLKNDFITNITHDFRSPLTAILNISDIALNYSKDLNCENKSNYDLIYNASLKLKTTIDRLLELAKMDTRGIVLKIRKVKIIPLLNRLLNFYKSSVTGTKIKIVKKFPADEISDFYSDPEKLEEIINNIMSNAVKFVNSESGQITVELKEKNSKILIIISDNGIGIPKDQLRNIFDRFTQVSASRNSHYQGTGIGLAFAKQLTGYLKGKIWAESKGKGKGANFIIELKKGKNIFSKNQFYGDSSYPYKNINIKKIIESEVNDKNQINEIQIFFQQLNQEGEHDYKKGIILIIDDDKNIRNIVMKYLSNNGYNNFILAPDGKLGLDAVCKYNPDIIICDYNMPNMKGDEFHEQLLKNPNFYNIPFIFLSAIVDNKIIMERKYKGAGAYLKKPIDEKKLLIAIEMHLKKYFEYLKTFQLTVYDLMTGFYNKNMILDILKNSLFNDDYNNLSILFFSIDKFDILKENYGPVNIDKILKSMGKIVKFLNSENNKVGRIGDNRFLFVLNDMDYNELIKFADLLREKIKLHDIVIDKFKINITVSIVVFSVNENEDFIKDCLNINDLKSFYNTINNNESNNKNVNEEKYKLINLILKNTENILKKTNNIICKNCNFSFDYNSQIKQCPKCGSEELNYIGNKIIPFA